MYIVSGKENPLVEILVGILLKFQLKGILFYRTACRVLNNLA